MNENEEKQSTASYLLSSAINAAKNLNIFTKSNTRELKLKLKENGEKDNCKPTPDACGHAGFCISCKPC